MNPKQKLALIKRNTAEILGEKELENLLNSTKKPSVYLGTAITKSPHAGYLLWAMKLADFAKAGFEVKLLLADVHGAMDNTPWEVLEKRFNYYKKLIPLLFESLGVQKSSIKFIKGSDFQLKSNYLADVLKLSTFASVRDSTKAASEVVKNVQGESAKLSGLIYPLMQALDEEYLKVDVQYGGTDQRKIFVLASEILPKIKYKKRIHIMTPLVPGLVGAKMSSSSESGKIDLLDEETTVNKKIKNAYCVAGDPDNGVMAFLEHVIFPLKQDQNSSLTIKRPEKFGGNLEYESYKDLKADFKSKKIHPLDVKNTLAKEINILLTPMRKNHKELTKLHKEAY